MNRGDTRELVRRRTPRTDEPDEHYYARNNEPSFFQFKDNYHFYDAAGRLYRIAAQNGDEFQNELLRGGGDERPDPIEDMFGHLVLYVKLHRRTSQWFDETALDRPTTIYLRRRPDSPQPEEYRIRIQSTTKPDYKRRTGTITVSGLNKTLCRQLLASRH
jgi:hypothetical protein